MCVNVLFPIIWYNDHKIILCIYAIISNWVLEFSHKGFLNVAGILRLALPGRHHRRSWGWTTKKVPWLMLLAGAIARDFCQMFMVVECSIAVVCMMHVACPWKVFEWTSFCFVRCLSTSPTQRSDWSASAQENSWDVEKCCRMCKSLNLVSGSFWGRYEQTCFVETAQTLLRSKSRRVDCLWLPHFLALENWMIILPCLFLSLILYLLIMSLYIHRIGEAEIYAQLVPSWAVGGGRATS